MKKWIVLLVLVVCLGCAHNSFIENAYDTIAAANSTVDGLMTYAGSQHCAGKLADQQKTDIIMVYSEYRLAADLADEALACYAASKTQVDYDIYISALAKLIEKKQVVLSLLTLLLYGGGE